MTFQRNVVSRLIALEDEVGKRWIELKVSIFNGDMVDGIATDLRLVASKKFDTLPEAFISPILRKTSVIAEKEWLQKEEDRKNKETQSIYTTIIKRAENMAERGE